MGTPKINTKSQQQAFFPPKPMGVTRFFRTCVIYQIFRFILINIKMLRVVSKSH